MGAIGKWVIFLMVIAGVSGFLMNKNGPGLIDRVFQFLGGAFQGTING